MAKLRVADRRSTPLIADVTDFVYPVVNGTLDTPLRRDEEVHVFDALTGEDLGAAAVDDRRWTLEDTRALSGWRTVVYIAQLIDAAGNAGELSNAYDVIIMPTRAGSATLALSGSAPAGRGAPSTTAVITDVASGMEPKTIAHGRQERAGDAGDTRLQVVGTLSKALRAGERVRVFDAESDLGNATVRGRAWTFQDTRSLGEGQAISYTAHVADAAGNLGPASSVYMMTIDTAEVED